MKQSQSNLVTSILENIVHTIPEDLVLQILEKLPAKSLMRFKCVSKRWCSMIEDPEFVDAFRVRSHIRGTKLLQKISRNGREISGNDLFLVDSEDIVVPLPVFQENSHVLVTPVEGLVCCNNTVYNPTTGKAIDLPSCNLNSYAKRMSEDIGASAGCYDWNGRSDYLLGFDVSLKKYKVLSICQMRFDGKLRYTDNWDIHEKQVYAEVLTLGTNSWKNISINYSLARELCQGFYVCRSCSINGTIYILINLGCGMDLDILTFDTSHEKFQLLHLQQELGYNYYIGYNYDKFVGEIEGHFALIHDDLEKVWILDEVSEGGKWTLLDLLLPAWWCTSRRFQGRTIGSNQSGEILFQVDDNKFSEEVRRTTIFSYTIESKDVRRMAQLDHPRSTKYFILPNFVETIHPLKPEF